MKVKFLDLTRLHKSIEAELQSAMNKVLTSGKFLQGEELQKFEEEFASFCRAQYCVGCDSGTAALHIALLALGIGAGDEVITVSHTFIATAEAIVHTGATPVFVDIEPETFLIAPDKIVEKITPRTRAIIVVHLYGQPVDMERVASVARCHNLWIIEDAAQAVGAEYNGKKVGTLGDVACFSFFPGKNLGALGDAGAIVSDNPRVAELSRMLINHGRKEKFIHQLPGYNYRLDELQAALLRVKLPYVTEWNERRRNVVRLYREFLETYPDVSELIKFPKEYSGAKSVYHLLVVRAKQRDELRKFLSLNGIETGLHYPIPLHLQPAFQNLGYKEGDLPVTEEIVREIISLPLDPLMTETEIEYVCKKIKEFYKTQRI